MPPYVKIPFYHLNFNFFTPEEAQDAINRILAGNKFHSLFFVNANCFNISIENQAYRNALGEADLVFNDGVGMSLAGRLIGAPFKYNLNGTDLIPEIIGLAALQNRNIYLLGGKPGIVEKATAEIRKRFPNANIVGHHHGFFNKNDDDVILSHINETKTDLLITGMGVPLQELWITRNKGQLDGVKLAVAGGAILDFLSGVVQRSPVWMRAMKIEWLYRLCREPRRLWRRYLPGNAIFFWRIARLRTHRDHGDLNIFL